MATSIDRFELTFRLPDTDAASYRPLIGTVLSGYGITVSQIVTGWCQVAATNRTFMNIIFNTPKNQFTEPEIITIANDLLAVLGTVIYRITKNTTESLL